VHVDQRDPLRLWNLLNIALGENRLGGNAVDANAMLADLRREVLRHHLNPGFRRGIGNRRSRVRSSRGRG
jgi:hypothetical protein